MMKTTDRGVTPCRRPCSSSSVGNSRSRNAGHLGDLQRRFERNAEIRPPPRDDDRVRHRRVTGRSNSAASRACSISGASMCRPSSRRCRRAQRLGEDEQHRHRAQEALGLRPHRLVADGQAKQWRCPIAPAVSPWRAVMQQRRQPGPDCAACAAAIEVVLAPLCDSTITSGLVVRSGNSATKSSGS